MKTVAVCLTHRLWPEIFRGYRRLRRQCPSDVEPALVVDATAHDAVVERVPEDLRDTTHTFTADEVLDVPYPRKVPDPSEARLYGGNIDLVILHLRELFPDCDRFWTIEYDVAFTGSWSDLFGHFADSDADLVGTTLTRFDDIPEWNHWPELDTAGDVDRAGWIRGFYPCVRTSRRGLDVLDRAYRRGWAGHSEAVMATALAAEGLEIRDMGGEGEFVADGDRNRFYTNKPTRLDLYPGTFVYRPARPSPGFRGETLWHPVKPRASRWASCRERIRRRLGWILDGVSDRLPPD